MDKFWIYYVAQCRYGVEFFAIMLLFSYGMLRRKRFWLFLAAGIITMFLISVPMSALRSITENNYIVNAVCFSLIIVASLVFLFLCRKGHVLNLIFTAYSALSVRMVASAIYDIIAMFVEGIDTEIFFNNFLEPICYYLILTAISAVVFFLFIKPMHNTEIKFNVQTVVFYVLILTINFMVSALTRQEFEKGTMAIILSCSALLYILLLSAQSIIILQAKAQVESYTIQRMWEQDKSQYTKSQETMDALRMQHHDLKHVVAHLKAEGVNEEYVGTLEKVMSEYSVYVDCGNKILDVVLSEKKRLCNYNGIAMTISANGAVINFMNPIDIYSLFGNALDNAVKYLKTFEVGEKKFINLVVCEERGMALIRIENYFEGELKLKNGLPATTQEDENYHGYGMKSMLRLTKKYQGNMTVNAEDSLFTLKFVFPIPVEK